MRHLEYDIIVAGGGSAGSAAAVAAARRGHRVLLVEEQNCLGGVSTAGGVGEWFAGLEGMGDIFAATVREMERLGARCELDRCFNPEYLKAVWQILAERAGVEILLHASVCDVARQGASVTEVGVCACSQIWRARARYFIDATGEGDLGALAGAQFMQGDPASGRVLHMTLTGWMYDTGKPQTPYLPADLEPIDSAEDLPGLGAGWHVDKHRVFMNATKIMDHDPTDPFSLSRAECAARRQLIRVAHYLQRNQFPTYALAASGAKIGIREGRRIVGDYVLAREEILNSKEPLAFADGVTVATSQVDFHSLTKPGAAGWRQRVGPYNIPWRCLRAQGLSNLLMAGKCISVDQVVHSSCRMTPTCCGMGQAAGTAAALAVENNCRNIRDVPVADLRAVLTADGMELDPQRHQPFALHDTKLDADEAAPG